MASSEFLSTRLICPLPYTNIRSAAKRGTPFPRYRRPNLNFLTTSRTDPKFRESLLISDLCTADGMPIVWLARMLGDRN